MRRVLVTIQRECRDADLPPDDDVRAWIACVLENVDQADGHRREISVRVVDEAEGRELNHRYRNQSHATNVLSFPAAPPAAFAALGSNEPLPLGDLVLCAVVIAREAVEQGKPLHDHWGHLLVHGTLHLLGYDHREAAQAREMEALEVRLLAERGVSDPYRERDSA